MSAFDSQDGTISRVWNDLDPDLIEIGTTAVHFFAVDSSGNIGKAGTVSVYRRRCVCVLVMLVIVLEVTECVVTLVTALNARFPACNHNELSDT